MNGKIKYSLISLFLISVFLMSGCGSTSTNTNTKDSKSPTDPTNLTAKATTDSQVNLQWDASNDEVGVTGYEIYRGTEKIGTTNSTNYSDANLTVGTEYCYKVTAYDDAGNISGNSNQSCATPTVNAETAKPSAPTALNVKAGGTSQNNLSWVASTDNIGVDHYEVYLGANNIGKTQSTNYNDTGLTTDTNYCYTVKAVDAAGNISGLSNEVCSKTLANVIPDAAKPSVPINLTGTKPSSSQIGLSWTPSTDNVVVAGYEIYRGNEKIGTTNSTNFSDIGLNSNVDNCYTIKSYDAAGNISDSSEQICSKTMPSSVISGYATAGPIKGADVTVYAMHPNGTDTETIGSGTTEPDGSFSVYLSGSHTGPAHVVISGGSYEGELDGEKVLNKSISAIVDEVTNGGSGISVNPLTDMVSSLAISEVKNSGASIKDAHTTADTLVSEFYGLSGKPEDIVPKFDKSSIGTDGFKLGFILGALDTCGEKISASSRSDLIKGLSEDIADGLFDGTSFGNPVLLDDGTSLPSTAGTTDFLGCASSYNEAPPGSILSSGGISTDDLNAADVLGGIKTAISQSDMTPKSVGLNIGSSGAISSMAFGGKQWLFIAARTNGVVAVDITDPDVTPTVSNGMIKVWDGLYSTTFKSNQIGGVIPLLGADHPQLFIFAYGSKHIALINADTGVVEYEADLPLKSGIKGFSGGSAYIAGGIPDTGRDGVWLATVDGYVFFDRKTNTLGELYPIDSSQQLAENLGGDISHDLLFSPNYSGLQIVDLMKKKSYYSSETLGISMPDGGAVDNAYQVGIITNEDSPDVGFINLKTIVRTDSDSGLSTFVPETGGSVHLNLGTGYTPTISGSAVDSATHMVLFMAGYSNDIAVGLLQDPTALPIGEIWNGLDDWRFLTLSSYSYSRDPHAVAVVNNIKNSKSYGYLLDGSNIKVLQLDMNGILTMPPEGTTGDGLHMPAGDPITEGFIVFRSW